MRNTAAILGLRSFWTQTGEALSAIGALDFPKEERRRLAKLYVTCGFLDALIDDLMSLMDQVARMGVSDLRSDQP
jgi:hypothetical protein